MGLGGGLWFETLDMASLHSRLRYSFGVQAKLRALLA